MKSSNDGKNRLALSGELLYHILRIIRHEGYTGYIITHSVRSQHIPELQIVDIELFKEANKMVSLRCNANAFERRVHISKDCIRRSQLKTIIRRNNYAYNE